MVLRELTEELARDPDLSVLLQRVVDDAARLIGCDISTLLLRRPEAERLEVVAASRHVQEMVGAVVPLHASIAGWVSRHGQERITMNVAEESESYHEGDETWGIRDALMAPLIGAGEPLGVLTVSNRRAEGAYSGDEVALLRHLANLAAAAIHNHRLHERSERLLKETRDRVSLLSGLLETGNQLRLDLDQQRLLDRICQMICDRLGWATAAISLRDYEAGLSRLVAQAGHDPEVVRQIEEAPPVPIERGESLFREEFRISNSYFLPHTHFEEVRVAATFFVQPGGTVVTGENAWHPEDGLLVPLELRGKILGFISPDQPRDGQRPTVEQIQALELFANQAAVAIDNARLYRDQQDAAVAMRLKARELEAAYAQLKQSQEQLVLSEKMAALGRMTGELAHEINSPLAGALNAFQLCRSYTEEYAETIEDPSVGVDRHRRIAADLAETLQIGEEATRRIAEFVRRMKGPAREHERVETREFDAAAELGTVLVLLEPRLRENSVTPHVDRQVIPRLRGDPGRFRLIVQNLLINAMEAYEGSPGDVWIRLRKEDGRVRIDVEDQGCGIPDEIRPHVFDYLFSTKARAGGGGLGLSIVHRIVTEHFRGALELRSEHGCGTTVTLLLPESGSEDR